MITRAVHTECVSPPIPMPSYDWLAHLDGDEDSGPFGVGRTRDEAIDDLAEQLDEQGNWL